MAESAHSRIFRDGLLDQQVCLVSGAGSGLGRETALELARLGAAVVGCGRREEPLVETAGLAAGLAGSFETYASMEQVLAHEEWPEDERPGTAAYLCGTLPDEAAREPARASAAVRQHIVEFLQYRAIDLWPHAFDSEGRFQWNLLAGGGNAEGPPRLESQYWTANVDPSDRYVQSLPGSLGHRLQANEAGYDNLFLAGDYVRTNIDLATMEGANESGRAAVNALLDAAGAKAAPASMYTLYQPPEAEPFKEIDRQRYRAGQPNLFDTP